MTAKITDLEGRLDAALKRWDNRKGHCVICGPVQVGFPCAHSKVKKESKSKLGKRILKTLSYLSDSGGNEAVYLGALMADSDDQTLGEAIKLWEDA